MLDLETSIYGLHEKLDRLREDLHKLHVQVEVMRASEKHGAGHECECQSVDHKRVALVGGVSGMSLSVILQMLDKLWK